MDPTSAQLEHAIRRNFGGSEKVQAYEIFKKKLPSLGAASRQAEGIRVEEVSGKREKELPIVEFTCFLQQRAILFPDCTPLGLIRTSLKTKETTWHGWVWYLLFPYSFISSPSFFSLRENRYLLFLTENYAALQVLKHYLQEVVGLTSTSGHVAGVGAGGLEGPGDGGEERDLRGPRKIEPFVLFGSSFPKDKEYTQVCELTWCAASLSLSLIISLTIRYVVTSTRSRSAWK